MPWDDEHSRALTRADFVRVARAGDCTVAEACRSFGISRKTRFKWLARASAPDPKPLLDRSRRPDSSPRKTDPSVEDAVLAAHADHPWGARKLHAYLCRGPGPIPSRGTIHDILPRNGLTRAKLPREPQRFERELPNLLWQMDFKGPLPGWTTPRYLFSVVDDHSRYLLAPCPCQDMTMATAWACLWEVFGLAGLPVAVLSDNGFAARGRAATGCRGWRSGCTGSACCSRTAARGTRGRGARWNATTARFNKRR